MKELLQKFAYTVIAVIFFLFARIIILTCRKEIIRSRETEDYEASRKPAIYALWHGRIFPMLFLKPKHKQLYAIISRHGDGEVIANVLRYGGVKAIRGSTNRKKGETKISSTKIKITVPKDRGGSFVIRESLRILEQGDSIVITPDGPKGPVFTYKTNSIKLASQTGTPIIPTTFSASKVFIFKSWDKFMLPLPFSKLKVHYGDLIYIPRLDSDDETKKYGKEVENTLNNLTTELDGQFGIKL